MFFASSSLNRTLVKLLLQQCDLPLVSVKYETDCFLRRCFLAQRRVLAD